MTAEVNVDQRDEPGAGADEPPRVVIVGGGFGGLAAAIELAEAPVRVTLIDRKNYHLFQPLLYQVATGSLSPGNIAEPLRSILSEQANAEVMLGEVTDIDLDGHAVVLTDGSRVEYDWLVVSAGARFHYFGNEGWERVAPGLKTVEDALTIRRRVLHALERAEHTDDLAERDALLTFVVVGGGPTGVELAGAIGELLRDTLPNEFRRITHSRTRVLLVEALDRILQTYPESLSRKAQRHLERIGVEARTGTRLAELEPGRLVLQRESGSEEIAAQTVMWAAGVAAVSLGRIIAERAGIEPGGGGRVPVGSDLALPGHPRVFVIGDMAAAKDQQGRPLPGNAPVALQQGKYVARRIRDVLAGAPTPPPFRYRARGNMATVGRGQAVADFGWLRFSGFLGWLLWLGVHLVATDRIREPPRRAHAVGVVLPHERPQRASDRRYGARTRAA